MIVGLGLKVQGGAGLEKEFGSIDFKDSRIGPGQAEAVSAQRVIADNDGANLNAGRGAAVFGQAGGDAAEANLDRRCIRVDVGGRCIDPKLRMVAIAAPPFVDDVEQAGIVRGDAFIALVRHSEGVVGIAGDGQCVGNRACTVNIDDAAIFLAQHQQIVVGQRRRQVGECVHIGNIGERR